MKNDFKKENPDDNSGETFWKLVAIVGTVSSVLSLIISVQALLK